jgi:putative nucleotidyltransferase with HDIG domain
VARVPDLQLLLADDDTAIRELLSLGFRNDFRLLIATDGAEAIEALKQTTPDAILVDEMMPGATGSEVLAVARERMPDVPRLLMTASQDPSAAMRAVNLGEIHRFYTKPLKVTEVRQAIRELAERARADQLLRAELRALRASQTSLSQSTTTIAILCEGAPGDLIERAAKRRGFVVKRAARIETLESIIGAGGTDVVAIDAQLGATAIALVAELARGVDVGTSLLLVEPREQQLLTCALAFELGAVDCLMAPWPSEVVVSVRLERAAGRPKERAELRRTTWELVSANRELAIANRRVQEGQVKLLGGLVRALEARDPYTAGHTDRVAEISVRCAETFGFTTAQREAVRIGALLHDIGKIGIRDEILYKPGRLTAEEYEVIKTHTTIGARILEDIDSLACAIPIVRGHHERPDGRGYPDGVSLANLPLEVRIVSGADVLDAITSTRPYRDASSLDDAFAILTSIAGTQLDAEVVVALQGLHASGRLTGLLQHGPAAR